MCKQAHFFFVFLFGFFLFNTTAQELPPIQNYTPQDYNGETQNWSISQDQSNTIYIANNRGLLQLNGDNWQLFPSPNKSIIRSTKVIDNHIYCGMYMEFGFWDKNEFGTLDYKSLSKKLKTPLIEDEQFWKIESLDNWILFQSLNRIYIYNVINDSFDIIESDSGINKMFKVKDEIYFQKSNAGLYKINSGKEELVSNNEIITNGKIINLFTYEDSLLLHTQENGFYLLNNNEISSWNKDLNTLLKNKSIYNSIKLHDGKYALGSIANGLILVDEEGTFLYKINQSQGLANNTVLNLFEDDDKNLWLALDNGITCINMDTPVKVFNDDNGLIGSVYAAIIYNEKLYVGTNQGLYFKNHNTNSPFKLIEGTQGQVWSLNAYQNTLFCGHDSGTFIIKNDIASLFSDVEGTWTIKPIENSPSLMIQGNYSGLYILEKNSSNWYLKNKIKNFDISSRYFEFINSNEIIVSHEYKGIITLKIDPKLSKVEDIKINDSLKGLKSSIAKHNGEILYAYENGVFKYNQPQKRFLKDSILSNIIKSNGFISGKMDIDPNSNRLWFFSKNQINYIEPGRLSDKPKVESIPLPYKLINSVTGYENVLPLGNNEYLIGTTNGYLTFDIDKLQNKNYTISINGINNTEERSNKTFNNTSLITKGSFPNNQHNIEFNYSINNFYKYFKAEYQYQLLGIYDSWSDWSTDSQQIFENLPAGDYTFNVRGKINNNLSNIASYEFNIERPWYLSNLMIAQYIIALLLFSLFMHYNYKRYYKKQRQKLIIEKNKEIELKELANQQQYMSFKNEKLKHDIEIKNRELAVSTMSLIKKNEFLSTVKNELKKVDSENLKSVIRIIDKNLNNTNDWKLFEEAFNNADKDFLKKIKSKHTTLTPNDLKLCAYLRLNLSSKEIAPLLNISPRSVEVKRYRLRKKMNLHHETSLANYILEL